MKSKQLFLIFLFSFFLQFVWGQQPTSYNYTTTDGLPSSETYDIIQDKKGFIWIATDRGVSRFDGYAFKNFTTNEGLVDNSVLSLYEDELGRIWFHAISGRLCYFENGKIIPYKYNELLTSVKGYIVRSFDCDSNNNLTIGLLGNGIKHISGDGIIKDLTPEVQRGRTYAGALINNKLHIYSKSFIGRPFYNFAFSIDKHNVFFEQIPEDKWAQQNVSGTKRKNGGVVVYGVSNVIELDKNHNGQLHRTASEIVRMYEDRDSCLWVAYKTGGVKKYGRNKPITSPEYTTYLKNEIITCVYEDSEGGIWLSSLNSGIFYIPSLQYPYFSFPNKFIITALEQSRKGDSAYIGFSNGIVYKFAEDGLQQKWNMNPNKDSLSYIYSLGVIADAVVVSSSYQTQILRASSQRKMVQRGVAKHLIPYKSNLMGCGNFNLWQFDLAAASIYSLLLLPIRSDILYIDRKEKFWFGDYTGLYYLKDSVCTKAFPTDSVLNGRISGIAEIQDGKMVISTIAKGLVIIDDGKPEYIDTRNGIASNTINCISVKNNEVWLGTNKGISRIIFSGNTYSIRNYSVENGLPNNEISNIGLTETNVWATTKKYLFYFDPSQISMNDDGPKIYIESVIAPGERISENEINYDQFPLKINYVGLAFRKRGHVLYKYRLKGLNDAWQYTNSTYAEFLSLPQGTYTFEILAQNEDGIWSSEPATYNFSIIPPFWKTWWFIVLLFILFCSLIAIYFYNRIQAIRRKNEMTNAMLAYRQQALLNQMNPHFIFNSLNSIQTFILVEEKKLATRYISKFARLMRLNLDNSRSEFISMQKEVEAISLYLELEKLRFKDLFSYAVDIDPKIDLERTSIPAMIIQPYVENCIKHAFSKELRETGMIRLNIFWREGSIICRIEDNGIGRKKATETKQTEKHTSAALSITEQRLQLTSKSLHQEFYFEIIDKTDTDGQATGTIVIFALPYKFIPDDKSADR